MKFFNRSRRSALKASMLSVVLCSGVAIAEDFSSTGISDVVSSADRMLHRGDYRGAIPALKEVINRVAPLDDLQGRTTAQTCRFQLARAYYQTGDIAAGMTVLETYLEYEPRTKERLALRMMAQGFFDTQEWEKIEELANRLLAFPDLDKDDRYNANLLLGQASFRLKKWMGAVDPLGYAAEHAKEPRVQQLCQIMVVRALVEAEEWRVLFGKLPGIYRTDSKYDISLNLTLMKAGKALYEDEDYLNSLMLYRWVLPRDKLLGFSEMKVQRLNKKLIADKKVGIEVGEIEERQTEIADIEESMETLRKLPAYEDEVTFRIGQIYFEVKRYWEGYVLFDQLYKKDRASELGEAAMLQSVLVLYDVNEIERAEERIVLYLNERPNGRYARTLLSMILHDNLAKGNFEKVVGMLSYIDSFSATDDPEEWKLQADCRYMGAFGYFQLQNNKGAGEQFSAIMEGHKGSEHYENCVYFRGLTYMLQADYEKALVDFVAYKQQNEYGENIAAALFREAVCHFGLEQIPEAEVIFTQFIAEYPENELVSEAYSMRGDIEAAKEATNEDSHTLDRALADYRKGIDKASTAQQSDYAAFQAAEVYKLEDKWQEIIGLMNYYMDRWEEKANVAEAVFWIGQSQIELGQVDLALESYLSAISRFGDDSSQGGVDKIILELVKVADNHFDEEDREELAVKLNLKLTHVDQAKQVLRLRLRVAQAMLRGNDIAAAFGAELLENKTDLKLISPVSLALMCDAAVDIGDVAEMQRLYEYFLEYYEESDLLWHAFRAKIFKKLAEGDDWGVLASIDEVQGMFGAEPQMGWAQILKADTEYKMEKYTLAEESYNLVMGVAEWRGPLFAEAMFGMGNCRVAMGDMEEAHSFYQRVYLLFKSYSDGDWAAKAYVAAADVLFKMGEEEKAISTLKAMLEDPYTNKNELAEMVREQLKNRGSE